MPHEPTIPAGASHARRPVAISAPDADPADAPRHAGDADDLADITASVAEIDAYLDAYSARAPLPGNLADAVRYSLLGPGKRLRPLLVWHACAAAGGDGTDPRISLPAAAAIELIHAFSLVHDDLPGLDNDDLRRGRPTLHRHTSEAMAILAGDTMLTLAFRIIIDEVADPTLGSAIIRELAESTTAMIAGQVYDTLGGFPEAAPGIPLNDGARLELIHRNKTGALIRASCRMGALFGQAAAGRADHAALDALTAYGEAIGLMFQIVDDILDVTQSTDHLGKRSGKDQDAGKLTYPGVYGVERSRDEVRRLHDLALDAIRPLGPAADPLRRLCSYMAVRSR